MKHPYSLTRRPWFPHPHPIPDQLMLWGWRIPFLIVWPTAVIGLALRIFMPEPAEFISACHKRQKRLEDADAEAALAAAEVGGGGGGSNGQNLVKRAHRKAQLLQRPLVHLMRTCWIELLLHAFGIAW